MYILEGNFDRAKEIGNNILNAGCIDSFKIKSNQPVVSNNELSSANITSGINSQQFDFFIEQCNVKYEILSVIY